jgi:Protein of unknown function (DUF433)
MRRWVQVGGDRNQPIIKAREFPSMVDALARGQSAEEIVEDFPPLTRDQVEAAIEYAVARVPLSPWSLKRALAELAGLGFDDESEAGEVAPRRIPQPRISSTRTRFLSLAMVPTRTCASGLQHGPRLKRALRERAHPEQEFARERRRVQVLGQRVERHPIVLRARSRWRAEQRIALQVRVLRRA